MPRPPISDPILGASPEGGDYIGIDFAIPRMPAVDGANVERQRPITPEDISELERNLFERLARGGEDYVIGLSEEMRGMWFATTHATDPYMPYEELADKAMHYGVAMHGFLGGIQRALNDPTAELEHISLRQGKFSDRSYVSFLHDLVIADIETTSKSGGRSDG